MLRSSSTPLAAHREVSRNTRDCTPKARASAEPRAPRPPVTPSPRCPGRATPPTPRGLDVEPQQLLVALAAHDEPRLAVAHEHDRRAQRAVVAVAHREAVG